MIIIGNYTYLTLHIVQIDSRTDMTSGLRSILLNIHSDKYTEKHKIKMEIIKNRHFIINSPSPVQIPVNLRWRWDCKTRNLCYSIAIWLCSKGRYLWTKDTNKIYMININSFTPNLLHNIYVMTRLGTGKRTTSVT